jgi:hypothetical protein
MGADNEKNNEPESKVMGADNDKYNDPDRRLLDRRKLADRRDTTRFSDVLGRRSGVDRRLPMR